MISFGNEELKNQPEIKENEEIVCPHCGQLHKIKCGTNVKTGEKTNSLSCYSCPSSRKTYLAGVIGKMI